MLRITADDVAKAGGLDAFIGRLHKKVPPPRGGHEVETWVVPMGTGRNPNLGFGYAAFHHDFEACIGANSGGSSDLFASCSASFNPEGSSQPSGYALATSPAPGSASWLNDFYFGNAD